VSAGVRVPYRDAYVAAYGLAAGLSPGCERIEIAGSIRRGRPDVGDIELVAVPRVSPVYGLLGDEPIGEFNGLLEVRDGLIADGTLAPHPTDPKMGPRYSKLMHPASGLQVDLFSARPETFGLILLIRTGPADYSRRFVTDIRRIGWHVANGELHRGGLGCGTYVCEVVPTPEERDVYAAIGHPWVPPVARDGLAALGGTA
jgi:DNA polymerase/3'-5' exonuclease PolX